MKQIWNPNMSLRARIFLSMLAILVLSSIMLVIAAGVFFKRENDNYHLQRLQRKEEAIKLSINYIINPSEQALPADTVVQIFDSKICELADINKLDINIHSLNGSLLISSFPEVFSNYNLDETIPNNIIDRLKAGEERVLFDHEVDTLHLLLSYSYIRNAQGNALAIINIPYLQADELPKQELKEFLLTLAQIYLVLLFGAGILAYFLSNYITRSLIEMKERIKRINLSEKNEKLEWDHNDEIGSLIREYNRMIDELAQSAELLARSEREGAWRKMARQVAHEIKNPLTPMKLSIQMLERQLDPSDPSFKQRLTEFTEAMVEQIDTLSSIAGSFSNFAQMPRGNPEVVDLRSIAASSVALYNKSHVLLNLPQEEVFIFSDKEHWIRVLNNLINNALQAIPKNRLPQVEVFIQKDQEQNLARIRIKDNGSGIEKEMQSVIFEPSFTTKTSGTGLGLAMVRNIVEMNRGKIWVESAINEGAEFHVEIPLHQV